MVPFFWRSARYRREHGLLMILQYMKITHQINYILVLRITARFIKVNMWEIFNISTIARLSLWCALNNIFNKSRGVVIFWARLWSLIFSPESPHERCRIRKYWRECVRVALLGIPYMTLRKCTWQEHIAFFVSNECATRLMSIHNLQSLDWGNA